MKASSAFMTVSFSDQDIFENGSVAWSNVREDTVSVVAGGVWGYTSVVEMGWLDRAAPSRRLRDFAKLRTLKSTSVVSALPMFRRTARP